MRVQPARELGHREKLDLGVEIEARLTNQIRQALELVIRIGLGIRNRLRPLAVALAL